MKPHEIEQLTTHLRKALAILEGENEPTRNPIWFRDTGHLSDKGIEHLHSLFRDGKTTYAVAKEMGMSYRATSLRRDDWEKKKKKS